MTTQLIKPKKEPKADKEQRRHLAARIDVHHEKLRQLLNRDQAKRAKVEPPEVVAARKIVEDYEEQVNDREDEEIKKLTMVRGWLREQALFAPALQALMYVKRYELCDLPEAMSAGSTMEDRNDAPLGLITQTGNTDSATSG